MLYFYNWFTSEFELLPKLKYKIPFYYRKSWICYTNPLKNNAVELAFVRGNELSDTHYILKANKRKQIRGVVIAKLKNAPFAEIKHVLQEAVFLDETISYKSKNKRS